MGIYKPKQHNHERLKDLKGVKELSKNEQKELNGGVLSCVLTEDCPVGYWCKNRKCIEYPADK